MPAKSKQQQKFMGMVHALNKGEIKPSDVSKSVKDVAKTIKKSDAEDFASTKHSGLPKRVKEQILKAFKEYASKMGTNTLGGDDYTTSRKGGLRDFDGYDNVDYNKDMPMDESKGVPQNYMQGRTSDYHTALRGRNRDYSGGTNFKKTNHGQPDLENNEEDQETNSLSVKQTPVKEAIGGMSNKTIEDEMKRHGIKKIPIDSHGERLLKGLQKEKFINKVDNLYKLTYFYATIPKGKRYQYGSAKKPLSPLFDYFQNELMGQNIILTSKMAAYRVSQNIIDMYNNNEEIDSPYYMLKNYFNSFGMDTNTSRTFKGAQYHLDQWLKRNKKYEKAMMKESINEGPSREEFRIAAMAIRKQAKFRNVSPEQAIQDQLNALKLLQRYIKKGDVKKYTGMNLSESINEAKLDHHRINGNSIELLVRHNREKFAIRFKDKRILDKMGFDWSKPKNIEKLLSLKKLPKGMSISRSFHEYGQRLDFSFIDDKEARLKGTPEPKDAIDRDIDEYSGGSYEYTKGDQYGQNSVNEIGIFPITSYMKGIIPADFVNTTTRDKKERLKSTLRDLKNTLNHFWKQHKIPYRIK